MTDIQTRYYVDAAGNYIGGFAGVDPPDGAIEVPSAPEDARQFWQGGAWSEAPEPVYQWDKMTLWLRLTDPEALQVDAAMALQPAKLRGVWNTAQSVTSDSEFFGTLKAFLTGVIGAARAAAVLAP